MMLVGACRNCGKPLYITPSGKFNIYCNVKCQKEYHEKQRRKNAADHEKLKAFRDGLTPQDQCRRCKYGYDYGRRYGCGYVFIEDRSRLSLHPEGMPKECQEFTPRRRKRRGQEITIR